MYPKSALNSLLKFKFKLIHRINFLFSTFRFPIYIVNQLFKLVDVAFKGCCRHPFLFLKPTISIYHSLFRISGLSFGKFPMPLPRYHTRIFPFTVKYQSPTLRAQWFSFKLLYACIILYGKDFMYNRPIIRCGCILNTTTFATNKQWHNQYLFPFNIGLNSLYRIFCSMNHSISIQLKRQ